MIVAAALLIALAQAAPREHPLEGFDPASLHAEAVFAERTRRFLDAWQGADDAGRERARAALAGLHRSGAPATAPPSLPALTLAWRALFDPATDERSGAGTELQDLADALDLQAVPGFFAARREGLGELVMVSVRRLWPVKPPGDVQVSLWWLPPPDVPEGAEVRARREPASPAAFEGAGFEMFLRPPASAPGEWRLVVELEHDGSRARGVPVDVPCLEDPPGTIGLAREVLEGAGPALELARGLVARARTGARLPAGVPPSEATALLRDRLGSHPGPRPRPVELGFRDREGRERWIWAWLPVEPPRAAIVLLAPRHEPPQAVFQGERGQLWRAAARDLSALLLCAHLPRSSADGDAAQLLARLADFARSVGGEIPVALVARGGSLDAVQRVLTGEGGPYDALIATTPRAGEPRLRLARLPTLFLAPGGPMEVTGLEGEVAWVVGEEVLLLDEARLPGLASSWLPGVFFASPVGEDDR